MFFDVYVSGEKVKAYGRADADRISMTLSWDECGISVFAAATCTEAGAQFHYSWSHALPGPQSEVRLVPVEATDDVAAPERRFEMGRAKRKAWERNVCEFCQRNETQVPKLIAGDTHRPGICSDCVDLCRDILSQSS
ncbi:ClpX C4-type zinc finger protein [Lysobacter sp. CA199]|uniref:ClpX C4-type zinc finger protein n=1 Tax=Lysobacter sp. CA199 TaxID=3455608 RepID=UPI003F8D194E